MAASGIWRWLLGALAAVLLATATYVVSRQTAAAPPPALIVTTPVPARPLPTRQPTPRDLVVYVSGAVATPGVYTLAPGSRAQDAVTAAGGALRDADLDHVNLAAFVSDGEQLAVPHQGERTPGATPGRRGGSGPTPTPPGLWLLNVNTATASDFQALPGIGKTTASRLVAYREQNGPYGSVDDLVKAGLRKTELARLRSRLTVQ